MTRQVSRLARLMAALSLITLGTVAAPAVSAGDPCFHGYVIPPPTNGAGTDVKLMPCAFEPTITTVDVGTTVTFVNGSDFTHLITGANQAWGSRDVEVKPNDAVSYTFDSPGIFPYACALHVGMSGAIVVGDPRTAAAPGTIDASNGGGSTGAGANAGTTSEATAANASTERTATDLPLVAIGVGAGLVAGAAAAWLAVRRRSPVRQPPVPAE